MKEKKQDLYDITKYSDNELYEMLDLNNPTDRELEAKILSVIDQYSNVEGTKATQIKSFFEDVYSHFFESNDIIEGMTTNNNYENPNVGEIDDRKGVTGNDELSFEGEKNQQLVQTTTLDYGASTLNPLLKETQKRVLQLDSQFRNYETYPSSTDYIINLSETLNNVVSLRLHSVSIPYTWYNISNVYNANYFQLLGNVDGIRGVYDLSFGIVAGSYNVTQLIDAINESVQTVASENTDIDFGTTGVSYNPETSKLSLTLDLQQVYNETNFYLYFNEFTNTFNETEANKSIPGFMGYGNLVIPKYISSNIDLNGNIEGIKSVPNAYPMESIYSNYEYSYNATGKVNTDLSNITYNQFNPNASFYVVINDPSNNVVGNNYFTIYNYDGPSIYSTHHDTSSNILESYQIEFGDVSGLYTRPTLLEAINRALLQNEFLGINTSLNQYDISYSNTDNSVTTLQRYQLRTLLNRETTKKKRNAKQVIIFPDENNVLNNLPQNIRNQYWQGPLWTGANSCFMFDESTIFTQPNSIRAENDPINTLYSINSSNCPTLLLQCNKPGYDNSYNNRFMKIATDASAGYDEGYTLNNLIGIYGYNETYLNSEINTKFSTIQDLNGNDISNGYVKAKAFYDVGTNRCRMQFDMLTYFNETNYTFDLSSCFLKELGISDASYCWLPGYNVSSSTNIDINGSSVRFDDPSGNQIMNIPSGDLNGEITPKNTLFKTGDLKGQFPFKIDNSNNIIVVTPNTGIGIEDISSNTIKFKNGTYRTSEILQDMVNNTFASIQGLTDANGTSLNGLNMSNTKLYLYDASWVLVTNVDNRLTQEDYTVVLSDETTDASYTNDWMDVSNKIRYSLDSSGDLVTSNNPGIKTGSMWNSYLGFTDASYSLVSARTGTEIVGNRDIMYDISKTLFVYESNIISRDVSTNTTTIHKYKNNSFSFIPQSNVKGLTDENGVKRIEIDLSGGIYPLYYLYNAINSRFRNNEQTQNSIVYSFFDNQGSESTVMQMNINKVYTAKDYVLQFYDEEAATVNIKSVNTNSFEATTWDVTLGWLLGFRAVPTVFLDPSDENNGYYSTNYSYNCDSNDIITLLGNTTLDLYLFKNLYLILNDYTQNHLNDGLITGVRNNPAATRPQYSSSATRICNPDTGRNQSSIFNSVQPGMGLTENQLYAANIIAQDNFIRQTTRIYSDPPFVKDMFALIPIKVSGLQQGDVFTEYGGTLQDNDRKYFGPVNISKVSIKLLNDHGDVINLNGGNWSFSLVFEYLYNMKGI